MRNCLAVPNTWTVLKIPISLLLCPHDVSGCRSDCCSCLFGPKGRHVVASWKGRSCFAGGKAHLARYVRKVFFFPRGATDVRGLHKREIHSLTKELSSIMKRTGRILRVVAVSVLMPCERRYMEPQSLREVLASVSGLLQFST